MMASNYLKLGLSLVCVLVAGAVGMTVVYAIRCNRVAEYQQLEDAYNKYKSKLSSYQDQLADLNRKHLLILGELESTKAKLRERDLALSQTKLPVLEVGTNLTVETVAQVTGYEAVQREAYRACMETVEVQDKALSVAANKEQVYKQVISTHEGLQKTNEEQIRNLGKRLADETRAKSLWRGSGLVAVGVATVVLLLKK